MKKTLQITIGGLIFNIEEDAYNKLSQYLEAIKKYFSSYESCEEITHDIEARIAEKFYEKNQNGGAIEMDDVDKIIKSMGTVSDFEAIKEDEDLSKDTSESTSFETTEEPKAAESQNAGAGIPPTKFYRDSKHKALAGVLAGLAHRFEFDVVWARILFIVLGFGLIDIGVGFFIFIAYFVCWIAFPERNDLEENQKIKKFYRNPENKVLGGVATGLSSYLGMDLVLVRVLFVVSGFFFIGIILYIIFWIVAPNAITITQKMELKGQAVTIENIESSIKTNSLSESPRQESAIAKLLLFPFRLIGIILKAFGKILGPIGTLVKIFIGLLLIILGSAFGFAAIVTTGVFFGLISSQEWISGDHIVGMLSRDLPPLGGFFGFLALFIPAIAIVLIGIKLITGQLNGQRNFWLTMLALWLMGIVGISAVGSKYALNFSKHSSFSEDTNLILPSGTLYLDALERDEDEDDVFDTRLVLEASENNNLTLTRKYSSQGRTREQALALAKDISYQVSQKDSVIVFPENFDLKDKNVFRDQTLEATLYIPKNKKFKMSREFAWRVYSQSWNLESKFGIDRDNIEKYTFVMDESGNIACSDCPVLTDEEKEALNHHDRDDSFNGSDFNDHGEFHKSVDVGDFKNVDFGSNFIVTIKQGSKSSVDIYTNKQEDLTDIEAKVKGNTLEIEYDDPFRDHNAEVHIYIVTNSLEDLNISGAAKAKILGFENLNELNINLSGASQAAFDIKAKSVDINAGGASQLILKGITFDMKANLSGASQLDAKDIKIERADVEAHGASIAKLGKIKTLRTDTSGGSTVERE
jgi:phage shock protein PspC (stress-responsive transcriptional regulator)